MTFVNTYPTEFDSSEPGKIVRYSPHITVENS